MHPVTCGCPACRLLRWQAQKYKNQFYVDPSLPQENLQVCPMYDAYGFCPHGIACFLPHVGRQSGTPAAAIAPRTPEVVVRDLESLDAEHNDDCAGCRVCGSTTIDHFGLDRVLPTAVCVTCCQPLYSPILQELIESLFSQTSQDYQAYKDVIDEYRAKIPNAFRISFSREAHRVGCSKFAWSLISLDQAIETLRASRENVPHFDTIVSVGASSGWVEHLYAEALRRLGVAATLEAYDEIPNARFDVAVQPGGPQKIRSRNRANSVLLLCWPPFGSQEKDLSTMGFDTLRFFLEAGGTTVIYIGDESSTGDFRFHGLLVQQFRPMKAYRVRHEIRRWVPQEMGMVFAGQDSVGVYTRR